MVLLDIVRTFYNFALDILPLFIIALAVSAVAVQYYPLRSLDELIQRNSDRPVLTAAFFGVLLPVTSGCRISMAAIARRGGAPWAPVLIFIGAGAAAGMSTVIMTSLISWQFAVLRLVVALIFALVLSLIISRALGPRLASAAKHNEIESLFHRDFCETSMTDSDTSGIEVGLISTWRNFLRLGRVVFPWLFLSIILAVVMDAAIPEGTIKSFFSGPLSAPRAALIGLPFYFISGTDVPLLFVLLKKGMSLGDAIAIMLAAPVVNLPVLLMASRWLGYRRAFAFIAICWLVASAIGALFGYVDAR